MGKKKEATIKVTEGNRIHIGCTSPLDPIQDLYDWFKNDEELRNYHIRLLKSTEGRESLSESEAGERVDTMFQFCVLVCEIAMKQK